MGACASPRFETAKVVGDEGRLGRPRSAQQRPYQEGLVSGGLERGVRMRLPTITPPCAARLESAIFMFVHFRCQIIRIAAK
jgi:hypothetical protein